MGQNRNEKRAFVGKPEGKRLLGRPKHRWEDNIKMDLKEIRDVEWIYLAQVRHTWWAIVNMVINLLFPYSDRRVFSSGTVGFSRRNWFHGVS
jgi:hypothetical protein